MAKVALMMLLLSAALAYFVGANFKSRFGALIGGLVAGLCGLALSAYFLTAIPNDSSGVLDAMISTHFTPTSISTALLMGVFGASFGFRRRKDKDRQKQLMEEINQAQE